MPQHYFSAYNDVLNLSLIKDACEKQKELLTPHQPIIPIAGINHKAQYCDYSSDAVTIGRAEELIPEELQLIEAQLSQCIPWRKGPFSLFGIDVDAEWRSDFKWNRLEQSLSPLAGKKILDVGCNNGYYMFRMLAQNPEFVLGIDPSLHCQRQFNLIQSYAQAPNIHFELLGIEHLSLFPNFFDTIFCMGILYHHRHPIQQLLDLWQALKPGGEVILETIGIPGTDSYALFPEGRYANMKNVWFIPTLSCFINWAKKAHFKNIEVISDCAQTSEEQRNTRWCPPPHQSLDKFIDPANPAQTIEGHPAPRRFCIRAQRPQ